MIEDYTIRGPMKSGNSSMDQLPGRIPVKLIKPYKSSGLVGKGYNIFVHRRYTGTPFCIADDWRLFPEDRVKKQELLIHRVYKIPSLKERDPFKLSGDMFTIIIDQFHFPFGKIIP